MMLSRSSPDQVGRISLTSSLRAIGPSMPSTKRASPSHQNIAVQRSSLAATSDRKARNEPDAVRRWTEKARACGQVIFFFGVRRSAMRERARRTMSTRPAFCSLRSARRDPAFPFLRGARSRMSSLTLPPIPNGRELSPAGGMRQAVSCRAATTCCVAHRQIADAAIGPSLLWVLWSRCRKAAPPLVFPADFAGDARL